LGKIDCPHCKKSVDEDMLFCPYCFNEFEKKDKNQDLDEDGERKEESETFSPPEDEKIIRTEKKKAPAKKEKRPAGELRENFFEEDEDKGLLIDNRYSIIEPFHFTCSRAVYKVEDVSDEGNYYSLREFLGQGEDLARKEEIIERFEETAENFVSLSHDNLSRIVDYFSESNYLYLVHEYIEGKNLIEFLHDFHVRLRQGLPEGLIVQWAVKLCDLFEYLHNAEPEPVYCIDFKPSFLVMSPQADNIIYINIGTAYVLDAIGLLETDGSVYIKHMEEQYKTPQRDLWCLGAIIYFLFTSVDIQKDETLSYKPLEEVRPDLSGGFLEVFKRIMGENRLSYYESARSLKRDLLVNCRPRPVKSYDFYYEYCGKEFSSFQWSTFLGNNRRSNSVAGGPRIPMKLQWSVPGKRGTVAHLFPYADKLLISFNDGEFFQADSRTGAIDWRFSLKESINYPVLHEDTIYASSSSSQSLIALKVGKSAIKWEVETENMVMSSPCVKEDMAYLVTYDGNILAVETEEGEVFWREPLDVKVISSPALQDENLYISALNGVIYSINLEERDFNWQFDTEGSLSASPALLEDWLIIGNHEGYLFCLERENGDLRWEFDLKGSITESIRAADEMILCVTKKGILHCLNPDSGETLWKVSLGQTGDFPFALTNNKLYMAMPDNKIYCIDAFTGKLIDKVKLEEKIISAPLVFNGALYFVTQSGNILCYR
jgi:outer membrane protein assembly factor BamB